jgi:hypothetical protein
MKDKDENNTTANEEQFGQWIVNQFDNKVKEIMGKEFEKTFSECEAYMSSDDFINLPNKERLQAY